MILFKQFKCAVVSHSDSLAFTHRLSLIIDNLCISGLIIVSPYLAIEFSSHNMTGGRGFKLIYAQSDFYYLSHE